jgi:hypothetical protein
MLCNNCVKTRWALAERSKISEKETVGLVEQPRPIAIIQKKIKKICGFGGGDNSGPHERVEKESVSKEKRAARLGCLAEEVEAIEIPHGVKPFIQNVLYTSPSPSRTVHPSRPIIDLIFSLRSPPSVSLGSKKNLFV